MIASFSALWECESILFSLIELELGADNPTAN